MTDRIAVSKTGPATTFYLECDRVGQDVNGNYTTLYLYLRCMNGPGGSTGSYFNNSGVQIGFIDETGEFGRHSGTPFLPSGVPNGNWRWRDGAWGVNIGHNPDGSRGGVTLRMRLQYGGVNEDHVVGFYDFPTIPRASTPSISPSATFEPGSTVTINTNRASTGFTHTIQYSIGGTGFVNIGTGVNDSVNWTPSMSLLNEFPNSPTGVGVIRAITYSGGTQIGVKDISFTLTTPAAVVPTWSSVTVSEDTAGVAATVGAYVQNVSKLDYTIVGAAGVYGSTISLQRFSVSGQTADGATGTTPNTISSSGTVPVTWLIQDSRGKQKTQTSNITVLPYSTPTINSCTIQRALSDGTPDPDDGTYVRVDLNAVTQSLMNVTQRNIIQIKVYSRLRGDVPWTLKTTLNPAGITYNSFTTIPGPFLVDQSYDIRVEVLDRFSTSAYQSNITVGAVFMHWDDEGLGLGKYRENGMLDVNGDVYVSGNIYTGGLKQGLLDENYIGPGPAKVYDIDNIGAGLSSVAYQWEGVYDPTQNRVVNLKAIPGGYVIAGHNNQIMRTSDSKPMGGKYLLPLTNNWTTYSARTASFQYPEPYAQLLPSGIVVLSGLINAGQITADTLITTLPVGMRPDVTMIFPVLMNSLTRAITIQPNGAVRVRTGWASDCFVSLDGIAFPAAGVASWTDVGAGGSGSSFANSWTSLDTPNYGPVRYWKDPYGLVWFSGLLTGGVAVADDINMITLPASHRSSQDQHIMATSADNFGFVGAKPGNGVNWKTGSTSAWVSLAGVTIITPDAIAHGTWVPNGLQSGWINYLTSQFPAATMTRRRDGLGLARGLIGSGTVGANVPVGGIPRHIIPEMNTIMVRPSNQASGRIDMWGYKGQANQRQGMWGVNFGSSSWFSLDGMKWMV